MTITVELGPEEETKVLERAAQSGQNVTAYVRRLIARDIQGVDEALAPFRSQVEERLVRCRPESLLRGSPTRGLAGEARQGERGVVTRVRRFRSPDRFLGLDESPCYAAECSSPNPATLHDLDGHHWQTKFDRLLTVRPPRSRNSTRWLSLKTLAAAGRNCRSDAATFVGESTTRSKSARSIWR